MNLQMLHDAEMRTMERTHQRDKKDLTQRNLELRNTVRSLRVSAACIHLSAVVLGSVIFYVSQDHLNEFIQPTQLDLTMRLLRPQHWSYQCGEVNIISVVNRTLSVW
jgi:hypothetical protein